ncbi:glutaredoxin-C6-like [Impatiens glandulifera]|uniref:glutaredoxin-C6-like n=1 Tax=Impatiens glandulifera TaxID=253017 RepID=UPI001FB1299C|nr:glutaredoxin-C6-like [Impatiens glandulifera]
MQGLRRCMPLSETGVRLELTPSTSSPLAIDVSETAESRIDRLISENPVVIFSRSACCMCHVMKRLLSTIGVHPTVIELDDEDISALPSSIAPAVFIGGSRIGGLESLVALHLSGHLVTKLVEVGALNLRETVL